jgi:hypothetical protein
MVPTLAATGIQRLELSVLISTAIQTAIGLSQGDISVWSALGRGTRFEILLPAAA